jgi:hypothetical protein
LLAASALCGSGWKGRLFVVDGRSAFGDTFHHRWRA